MIAAALVLAALDLFLVVWGGIQVASGVRMLEVRLDQQRQQLAELDRRRNGARKLIEAWPPDLEAFKPQEPPR